MNIKQKANKFRSIVNDMADLYEKKNSNYGDSFGQLFEELGPTAGLVPLWNKLHRATSLVKGNQNNFESLEDTFKDLACYAIMNLIEMEAQKEENQKNISKLVKESPNHDTFEDVFEYIHPRKYADFENPVPPPSGYVTGPKEVIEKLQEVIKEENPCEGCETKKMLDSNLTYVGDLPCQLCSKNPYKFSCGSSTATHSLKNRNTTGGTYED